MNFQEMVTAELTEVRKKHKPINSLHEGYGLLAEEVDEFFREVCKKSKNRLKDNVRQELVQIAGICQRIAEDLLS